MFIDLHAYADAGLVLVVLDSVSEDHLHVVEPAGGGHADPPAQRGETRHEVTWLNKLR